MKESHVAKEDVAKPVRQSRGIIPFVIGLAILLAFGTLGSRLMEQERFLLAACAACISLGSWPLFTRWALMRVHGNWSRIPRGTRRGIRFLEVGMIVNIVAFFVMALLLTQRLEDNRSEQEAFTLNEQAVLYLDQLKYEKAEALLERSLAIREKALGPEHPLVADSLRILAQTYFAQGKYDQAEPLYKRSLAIREKVFDPEHRDVAAGLSGLARLYSAQAKDEQAELLFKRALAILERGGDSQHTALAACLHNLADLYNLQYRYDQAEPLYKRSLAILEEFGGLDDAYVARHLEHYAELLKATDRMDEAEAMQKRAAAIRKKYEK